MMKLIKFSGEDAFRKWFRRRRSERYFLIDYNYYGCLYNDSVIYRAVINGKDVGIVFISRVFDDSLWIDLFEVREECRRRGYGSEMLRLLIQERGPVTVRLSCVRDRNDRLDKNAYRFWRSKGFRLDSYSYYDSIMVKKFKNK